MPEPDPFVRHIALDDVGAGYDIESTWPGHERFIEVKSTAGQSGEIFISAREREVLLAKGRHAWLYRVSLGEGEASVQEIHDPMNLIPDEHFTPQVWRVKVPE
ncbi:MAG: DUF3883 domain-containing protein [Betaproteobacteria bacterium]|nr:DUF3883 domain-containing protein [Betaproteobacteria bacterium]